MELKEVYLKKVEARLKAWEFDVERVKAKIETVEAHTDPTLEEFIEKLTARIAATKAQIRDFDGNKADAFRYL